MSEFKGLATAKGFQAKIPTALNAVYANEATFFTGQKVGTAVGFTNGLTGRALDLELNTLYLIIIHVYIDGAYAWSDNGLLYYCSPSTLNNFSTGSWKGCYIGKSRTNDVVSSAYNDNQGKILFTDEKGVVSYSGLIDVVKLADIKISSL